MRGDSAVRAPPRGAVVKPRHPCLAACVRVTHRARTKVTRPDRLTWWTCPSRRVSFVRELITEGKSQVKLVRTLAEMLCLVPLDGPPIEQIARLLARVRRGAGQRRPRRRMDRRQDPGRAPRCSCSRT